MQCFVLNVTYIRVHQLARSPGKEEQPQGLRRGGIEAAADTDRFRPASQINAVVPLSCANGTA